MAVFAPRPDPAGPSRREAWTLRKALLVVALVFASFAGGAVVNGPGLSWLKGLIGDRLHRGDAIPTLDVDDGPPVAVADAEPSPAPAPAPAPIAAAAKPASPAPEDAPHILAPANSDPPADPPASSPVAAEPNPLPLPELPASAAPAPEPAKPLDKTPTPAPARAAGWEDAPGPAPSSAVLPRSRQARDRPRDPTADSAVAAAGVPAEPPPLTSSSPAGSPNPGGWPALRMRMKNLGVTRYWVEGTPGGTVTFRCVAHPDGPDSADRQFEAEADDESQAAESALRRVAVWRAAERVKG